MSCSRMVGTRVPSKTVEDIRLAVEKGYYLTPSDLIRAAIDNELKRLRHDASKTPTVGDISEHTY